MVWVPERKNGADAVPPRFIFLARRVPGMAEDTPTPWISILVVFVGLVVLLYGVYHHNYNVQLAGGGVGLLGFGMLTAYIAKL